MKKLFALLIASVVLVSAPVFAQVDYNAEITAIMGSGNPNTGWNAETENDITLALRAKNRTTGVTDHLLNVYTMPAGLASLLPPRAKWNYELSIRTGSGPISQYDYYILIDTDASVGINYVSANVLTTWPDNSFGNDSTANGQGIEVGVNLADTYNIVQQSQNFGFGQYTALGIDPAADGTYDFVLYAVQKGAGPNGVRLASVSIQVVVGNGGATIAQLIDGIDTTGMNHGDYVNAVKAIARYLFDGGVINNKEMSGLISTAAKSDIGK